MWAFINLYEDGLKICHTKNILRFDANKHSTRKLYKVKICGVWVEGQILKICDKKSECAVINAGVISSESQVSGNLQVEVKNLSNLSSDSCDYDENWNNSKNDFLDNGNNILQYDPYCIDNAISFNVKEIDEKYWNQKYFEELEEKITKLEEQLDIILQDNEALKSECEKLRFSNVELQNSNGKDMETDITIKAEYSNSYMSFFSEILKGKSHRRGVVFENNEQVCIGRGVYITKSDFYNLVQVKTPPVFLGNLALLVIGREDMVNKSISGKMTCKSQVRKDKVDQCKLDVLYDCFKQYLMAGKHEVKSNLKNFHQYISRKMATELRRHSRILMMDTQRIATDKQLING